MKRNWGGTNLERSLTFEFLSEDKTVVGREQTRSKSLPLTYAITKRDLDSLLFPTKGYVINAQVGGALLPVLTDERFVRVAGPKASNEFHARSADGRVKDASATSPAPASGPVTRLYKICAPSPLPPEPRLVVKNGSNNCPSVALSMPMPSSL